MKLLKRIFHKGEMAWTKIICLAVGMSLGFIILAEVIYERTSLDFIPNVDEVYKIKGEYIIQSQGKTPQSFNNTAGGVAKRTAAICPLVKDFTRFTGFDDGWWVSEDKQELSLKSIAADEHFFDMFSPTKVSGEDPHKAMLRKQVAYISRSKLKQLGEGIIGKTLAYRLKSDYKITIVGVFDDFPRNTHFDEFDMVVSIVTMDGADFSSSENLVGNDRYSSYFRLKEGVTPAQVVPYFKKMMDQNGVTEQLKGAGVDMKYRLKELSENYDDSPYFRIMNIAFLAFGIMILAVALFNYLLLSMTVVVNRAKNIATHRCFGATDGSIFRMVFGESLVLVGIFAIGLAMLIAFSLRGTIEMLVAHSMGALLTRTAIRWLPVIIVSFILICAAIPAILYTRIPVVYAYRKFHEHKRHWKLALLFVQMILTAIFVELVLLINWQYDYLVNYDMGFNSDKVITFKANQMTYDAAKAVEDELNSNTNVAQWTFAAQDMAGRASGNNVFEKGTDKTLFNFADLYAVGPGFLKLFDIPLLEGRFFVSFKGDSARQEVIVSESFARRYEQLTGLKKSIVGETIHASEHDGATVCGVYRDFTTSSLLVEDIDTRPSLITPGTQMWGNVYVKLVDDSPDKLDAFRKTIRRLAQNEGLDVVPLRTRIANNYSALRNVQRAILLVGASIFIIMFVGLVAYLKDEINRRCAELALRIIHGASVSDIIRLFVVNLLKMVVPGVVIGGLAAYYFMQQILTLFSAKMPFAWYHYLMPLILLLAMITVFVVVLIRKAAQRNPIENIKTE